MSIEYIHEVVNKMYDNGNFDMEDAKREYDGWLESKEYLQNLFLNEQEKVSFQFKAEVSDNYVSQRILKMIESSIALNYELDEVIERDIMVTHRSVMSLIRTSARYENCSFAKIVKENKVKVSRFISDDVEIQKGMRITKAIMKVFETSHYKKASQDFINHYSMLMQKSYQRDTLYISTKPEDIISMSDNSNGWRSCMAPDSNESYKYGTIEWANHPGVMVAYLKSSDSYKYGIDNKKWRALIIIGQSHKAEPSIMIQKHYPYYSEQAEKAIVDYLESQLDKNRHDERLGWRDEVVLNVSQAYKDSGNAYGFPKGAFSIFYDRYKNYYSCPICYSNEMCECVGNHGTCDYCGVVIHHGDLHHTMNGEVLCDPCLHENYTYCEDCGDMHPNNEVYITGYDDYICQDCMVDYGVCDYCGQIFTNQDLYEEQDGSIRCPHC